MVAVCEEETTQNWLVEVVPSFELPGGLRLKAVSMNELLEYKKVAVRIPGPPVDTELLLKRLQRQNKNTQGWNIFERKEGEGEEGRSLGAYHRHSKPGGLEEA